MDNKTIEQNDEVVIDLQRVFGAIVRKLWLIALAAILGGVFAFVGTHYLITPKYQSSAMFYVNNSALSLGDVSLGITSSDITASKNLVNSYIVILKTRETLNDVIDYSGIEDMDYEGLVGMISASSVSNTEIFRVTVTSTDPNEAEQLANAIAYVLPKRISGIIEGTSSKVVEAAVADPDAVSPSYSKNTMTGFAIGLILSLGIIALREIFDITVRAEDDIRLACKYPILAAVPDMANHHKSGYGYYYYGYGRKKYDYSYADKSAMVDSEGQPVLIGGGISFSAAEAYRLLRTKLQFSFADENTSRVIGISSALTGEGKSLSAVNLAYTLSQLDKKVLLIDCDMRRPSLATKLPIERLRGLSSYLSGQIHMDNLIQKCGLPNEENAFDVISAGHNPPNPMELLSSARMTRLLTKLRELYDYVILDFPPVGEVSDAMALAGQMDGTLLVVRQNYCNRIVLGEAVHQFEFVNSKILGVVYNCTSEDGAGYGYSKRYYKKYYKKYGKYGYGSHPYRTKPMKEQTRNGKNTPIRRTSEKTRINKQP